MLKVAGGGGGGIAVGTTPITGGTSGTLLYDNASTVGELVVGTGLSINSGTITATGTSAAAISIGGTVTGGINGDFLYVNTGVLAQTTATGSGSVVLSSSPTLTGTPVLSTATATTINGLTIPSTTGTLSITNAKTLAASNSLTLAGTDGSTLNVGAGGTLNTLAFLSAAPAGTLVGNAGTVSAVPAAIPLGSHLTFTAGTLDATGYGTGTVTSVVGGTGTTGGTITAAGTIAVAQATTSALGGVIVGSGLAVSTGTISNSGILSLVGGSDITIANGNTISVSNIGTNTLLGNFGTSSAAPSAITLGTGVSTSLANATNAASGFITSTNTATAGGIGYGNGTNHTYTAAGTAGQVVLSGGAGAPTYTTGTLALAGNFSTAAAVSHTGAFAQTFTGTAASTVTLPPGITSNFILSTGTQLASNPVTGTPSSSNFLRGDGTWAAPSGSGTVTSVAQSFTGGLISVSGSPVTTAGTLVLTVAGTSGGVPYFNSGTTWLSSAALAANAIVVGGGAGAAPATVTTNSTVLTALGVAPQGSGSIVLATSPTLTTPTIGAATATTVNNVTITNPGTTAVLTLANGSTLSTAGSVTHAGAFAQTFTATGTTSLTLPTSGTITAQGNSVTGSGGTIVLATGPVLVTPTLGAASATTVNNVTITNPGTTAVLTIANAKTLSASNSLTLAGTDGSTLNVGTGGTLGALAFSATAPAGTLTGATLASGVTASSLTSVGTLGTLNVTGNVGIGTSSPGYKLQVAANTNGSDGLYISNTSTGASAQAFLNVVAQGWSGVQIVQNQASGSVLFYSADNVPMIFDTNAGERMRITAAGSVGIGTFSPGTGTLLDVQSTTAGVRFPNMTTTQKTAITPAAGTVVFDTTLAKLCLYTGAAWQTITSV